MKIMQTKRWLLLASLAGFFMAVAAQAQFPPTIGGDFQMLADVTYSMQRYKGDYEVQLVRLPNDNGFELRFVRNKKTALSFPAHQKTGFKEVKGVVYYDVYSPSAEGCTVVAYSLKEKKELWRTRLEGMGTEARPTSSNMVILDADEESVQVRGHETFGDYKEKLETTNGTSLVRTNSLSRPWGSR